MDLAPDFGEFIGSLTAHGDRTNEASAATDGNYHDVVDAPPIGRRHQRERE
jgi:hypothetical protein